MTNKIIAYAKAHPAQAALIGVVGIGAIVLMSGSKSGTQSTSGQDPAMIAANIELSKMQAAANAQSAQLQAQLTSQLNNNATALQIAQLELQGQTANTANTNKTQLDIAALGANVQTQQIASVERMNKDSIAGQLAQVQSNNAAVVNMAQLQTQMNTNIAYVNAQQNVAIAGINSATQIGMSNAAANVAIAQSKYGFMGMQAQAQAFSDAALYQMGGSMFSSLTSLAGLAFF